LFTLNSAANYQTAWQNFNTWWGFLRASAAATCPPPAGALQGVVGSDNGKLVQANTELVKCGPLTLSVNNIVPAFAWDFPNDDIFVIAEGTSGASFSALVSWLPSSTRLAPARLARGVAPLVQLLPSKVNSAKCKAVASPGWTTPGLVESLACYDSALGNGDSIYAFQMDSSANYQASWMNFNTWWRFNPSSGSGCPPSGSTTQGSKPWDDTGSNGYFPAVVGQTLECGRLGIKDDEPTFAWSFPSEDAYIIAIANPNSTFSSLGSWWTANSEPTAPPSPATP
jgi:hypothetical protein